MKTEIQPPVLFCADDVDFVDVTGMPGWRWLKAYGSARAGWFVCGDVHKVRQVSPGYPASGILPCFYHRLPYEQAPAHDVASWIRWHHVRLSQL